ncbi:MAG: twin-arginine translocase TatA/TatE family subunit [Acidimicrobiia bacterium]
MPNLGPMEIFLIVAVIVLLFGARKLPEIARSMGKARGEFKKGLDEGDKDAEEEATKAEEKTE